MDWQTMDDIAIVVGKTEEDVKKQLDNKIARRKGLKIA